MALKRQIVDLPIELTKIIIDNLNATLCEYYGLFGTETFNKNNADHQRIINNICHTIIWHLLNINQKPLVLSDDILAAIQANIRDILQYIAGNQKIYDKNINAILAEKLKQILSHMVDNTAKIKLNFIPSEKFNPETNTTDYILYCECFQINSTVAPMPTNVFKMQVVDKQDKTKDILIGVCSIGDLTSLPIYRELNISGYYSTSNVSITFPSVAVRSSGRLVLTDKINKLLSNWNKYNLEMTSENKSGQVVVALPATDTTNRDKAIEEALKAYNIYLTAEKNYIDAESAVQKAEKEYNDHYTEEYKESLLLINKITSDLNTTQNNLSLVGQTLENGYAHFEGPGGIGIPKGINLQKLNVEQITYDFTNLKNRINQFTSELTTHLSYVENGIDKLNENYDFFIDIEKQKQKITTPPGTFLDLNGITEYYNRSSLEFTTSNVIKINDSYIAHNSNKNIFNILYEQKQSGHSIPGFPDTFDWNEKYLSELDLQLKMSELYTLFYGSINNGNFKSLGEMIKNTEIVITPNIIWDTDQSGPTLQIKNTLDLSKQALNFSMTDSSGAYNLIKKEILSLENYNGKANIFWIDISSDIKTKKILIDSERNNLAISINNGDIKNLTIKISSLLTKYEAKKNALFEVLVKNQKNLKKAEAEKESSLFDYTNKKFIAKSYDPFWVAPDDAT